MTDAKHRRQRGVGGRGCAPGGLPTRPPCMGDTPPHPTNPGRRWGLRRAGLKQVKTAEVCPVAKESLGVVSDTWSR